jgi:hypothetical protein
MNLFSSNGKYAAAIFHQGVPLCSPNADLPLFSMQNGST